MSTNIRPLPVYLTIREQITERLRSEVLSQKLTAGTSLREQFLAEKYGVSRAPVRDALLQLSNEGLLIAKPNCGVKVAELPDKSVQPLIIQLRRDIESFCLNRVMDQADKIDFAPLRAILAELKTACKNGEISDIVHCDMAFHRFIITSAGNNDLLALWLPIVSRMMLNYARLENWMESYNEHAAIAAAIEKGDAKLAAKLLLDNIK